MSTPGSSQDRQSSGNGATAAPAGRRAIQVVLRGTEGSGKTTLRRHLETDPEIRLQVSEALADETRALLWVCPADYDSAQFTAELRDFLQELGPWLEQQGRKCATGAFPVFLIRTRADLLARPGMDLGEWLETLEAAKHETSRTLANLRTGLPAYVARGFGSPAFHIWGTSTARPQLREDKSECREPYGIRELAHQLDQEARSFTRRRRRQGVRVGGILLLIGAMLFGLSVTLWDFLNSRVRPPMMAQEPEPPREWPEGELLAAGRADLAAAEQLLRFEGYDLGPEKRVDWPGWNQQVSVLLLGMDANREKLVQAGIGQSIVESMNRIELDLRQVRDRAAMFGLAGEAGGLPRPLELPATLEAPSIPTAMSELVRARLLILERAYPGFRVRRLSERLPVRVVRELEAAAEANHENLLDPIRNLVIARVMELGDGKETPDAWKEFARTWPPDQVEADLAEWRQLSAFLQTLSGRIIPTDPITELVGFLTREQFRLPMEQLELSLPDTLEFEGKRIGELRIGDSPLMVQWKPGGGRGVEIPLYALPGVAPLPQYEGFKVFGVAKQNPLERGRIVFKPGDEISASIRITDQRGNFWRLSWPSIEARSQVYSFGVLMQVPRLHPEDMLDPTKGSLAFGARLVPTEPSSFELPALFPR